MMLFLLLFCYFVVFVFVVIIVMRSLFFCLLHYPLLIANGIVVHSVLVCVACVSLHITHFYSLFFQVLLAWPHCQSTNYKNEKAKRREG